MLSLAPIDIKFYVSPAPKLSPRGGEPSEQAEAPLPREQSADEGDAEEEESGALKDTQKGLEKGQGAQQLEGNDMVRHEPLGGGEEWIVESLTLRLSGVWFSGCWFMASGSYPPTLTCVMGK